MNSATSLSNSLDGSGALLGEVEKGTRIHLWRAIDGESFFTIASSCFCDEENDNLVTIEVIDSQGELHRYTTGDLGLTCDRHGVWRNVAWTY